MLYAFPAPAPCLCACPRLPPRTQRGPTCTPKRRPPPGVSHTFFVGANDKPRAGELINVLREAKQASGRWGPAMPADPGVPPAVRGLPWPCPNPARARFASLGSCTGTANQREVASNSTHAPQEVPEELLKFGTTVKKKESKLCEWPGTTRMGPGSLNRPARRAAAPPPPVATSARRCFIARPACPCPLPSDGAHFKDVDHTQKSTKMTFDSDDE